MKVSNCCGAKIEYPYVNSGDPHKMKPQSFCSKCKNSQDGSSLPAAPKKEKESTEVRDEKIARIIKEFRELYFSRDKNMKFPTIETYEAWLTQTLTTLLNEE